VDKSTGICADQTIVLTGKRSRHTYPEPLRRVSYVDSERHRRLLFLTNAFEIPANPVAYRYKQCWQVELFLNWIKQHLRIKTFYGNSVNAVNTEVWVTLRAYLLVALDPPLPAKLHTVLRIVDVNHFEQYASFVSA